MATKSKRAGESSTSRSLTVPELRARLSAADASELEAFERSFASDTRKGVRDAFAAARKRIESEAAEARRIEGIYSYQHVLARSYGGERIAGLDEVGRGPLAGPLCVAAVVLPDEPRIAGLNDSKQVKPEARKRISEEIKSVALAWSIEYIQPGDIDAAGMTACLKMAFRRAIAAIDAVGASVGTVLLDGNPLHCDPREVNVIKGDSRCASIAAASIIAKVDRDALMEQMDEVYPEYGFASNKGYGSAEHIRAIREHGLCPLHRASFCTSYTQESLF